MKKYCAKIAIFLIGISFLVASCEHIIVVDKPDVWKFSVQNNLTEDIIISGTVAEEMFSIALSPNESYTYTLDSRNGFIEKGKAAIYSATAIKIVGSSAGTIEFQADGSFQEKWIEETEHHLVLKITRSLFPTE